ncbi:hypothetical protein QC762_0086230 [Podospora pseudocomata]|uniref:Uncharacterized protein n=1 Tax=Podospora pseudocomata TaxID=2093779 RepID=A0ABR0GD64_9PEZI|nr:hypothetical protein QC762_0086230 [Podospora pseudocomata]
MTAAHHGPWTPIEIRAASFPWPSSESRRLRSLPLGHRQLQQHTRTPPDPKGIKPRTHWSLESWVCTTTATDRTVARDRTLGTARTVAGRAGRPSRRQA